MTPYVPDAGELVWLEFDPQAGREVMKTRPALVLTPASYNRLSRLAVVCPVTPQVKGYPFEVLLSPALATNGVVIADQVRSLDWSSRHARPIERVPAEVLDAVLARVAALLGL